MNKQCMAGACEAPAAGMGRYCETHKRAFRRHGHPLQSGITVPEVKPFIKRVKARINANETNPTWSLLAARWESMVDISRAYVTQMKSGAAFNRYEARAHQAILNLANTVDASDVTTMALGMYMLREEQGRRFHSDEAFTFQLVRRVMLMSDVHVGTGWNPKTGKTFRVYKEPSPRVTRIIGGLLQEVFGTVGLYVASLEAADKRKQEQQTAELHAALEALQ
ncbi:hypothetical protein QCE47_02760 [Caballeronia sp. LZ025]|uniref:hypothetical protein n=1 Tax=Caballeronia TaxID=1827195 RepID=UPI001FCFCEEE|nr:MULTISPECIES: hypothetical protein [Caballeronia]MDR5731271.1 hypothetical protein [Caballeronia sp. LZ025]